MIGSTVLTMNAQNIKDNPLLKDWTGNYGGVPAFNEYKVSDFKPALEFAMQEKLNEVNAIANNPKPATFQNTIGNLNYVLFLWPGQTFTEKKNVYVGVVTGHGQQ